MLLSSTLCVIIHFKHGRVEKTAAVTIKRNEVMVPLGSSSSAPQKHHVEGSASGSYQK